MVIEEDLGYNMYKTNKYKIQLLDYFLYYFGVNIIR